MLLAMMTEKHKGIDKQKVKDKEKIQKMDDLLKTVQQQIETLVKFRIFHTKKLFKY